MPATGECASSPIGSAFSPDVLTNSSALGMNCRAIGSSGFSAVDQAGDIGRHGDGIARGDPFEVGEIGGLRQAALDELGGLPQRCRQFRIYPVHGSPAGGVHTT